MAEPASTIPSGECIRVVAEKGADKTGYRTVVTADQWVKDNKVEVLEVSSDIAIDNLTQVDLLKMLSQCDAYVFLLNSQSALNQTDLTLIRLISKVKTPALVILTHSDLLQPGDLAEVENTSQATSPTYPAWSCCAWRATSILPTTARRWPTRCASSRRE